MHDVYENPLTTRYASHAMQQLFSQDTRTITWRKLWVALAESEMELGLPVTQAQVDELKAHITDIDYDAVARKEREIRHDSATRTCSRRSSPRWASAPACGCRTC